MPYITKNDRLRIDQDLPIVNVVEWSAGDLTYGLTRLVVAWFHYRKSYLNIAIVIGCLVCTILEFYRRVAAPYEDEKIRVNGDVY